MGVSGPPWAQSVFYTHYYKVWSNLIVTTIIPLTVLVFCNVGILVALKRSRRSMRPASNYPRPSAARTPSGIDSNGEVRIVALNGSSATTTTMATNGNGVASNGICNGGSSSHRSNEHSLAAILIGIVVVFMVCHACRFFLAFYQVWNARPRNLISLPAGQNEKESRCALWLCA